MCVILTVFPMNSLIYFQGTMHTDQQHCKCASVSQNFQLFSSVQLLGQQ